MVKTKQTINSPPYQRRHILAGVTFTPDTIAIPVQLRRIKTIASVDFMANIGTAAATTCRLGSFLYWRRLFVYRLRALSLIHI